MTTVDAVPSARRASRILVVHNAYQQRGGEEAVVETEMALLRAHGHGVEFFSRHNDELIGGGGLRAARDTLWSKRTMRDMSARISAFRPHIIHVHNTFPLISPSVYWSAARVPVPVVQTLHNFRLLCAPGTFLRGGKVCEDCLGRLPWRGIVHRCYRGSARHTAVLVAMLGLHRAIDTYQDKVTRYIALTEFSRSKLVQGGLPAAKILVKPNFVNAPRTENNNNNRRGGLFVGRLSQEKGTSVLLAAMDRLPQGVIHMIGSGPEQAAVSAHSRVRCHGRKDQPAVLERMRAAQYLVVPSICYESFPRTIVEAFACGLPVIASRLGAMAEIVEDGRTGLLFEAGSDEDLARKIAWAEANPAALHLMGGNARREYEMKYTPEVNYRQLIKIYAAAMAAVPGADDSGG
jgi:glycosyltransferase involved in cell wall biosynthesis